MNKNIKQKKSKNLKPQKEKEIGGPTGPEPTRYGVIGKKKVFVMTFNLLINSILN